METMELQVLPSISLRDIVADPNTPDEVCAAAVTVLDDMARQIREAKALIAGRLTAHMESENATKLKFRGPNGDDLVVTLKPGPTKCEAKNADEIYKQHGFDPLEIGTFEFHPLWSKAKEARKLGGEKQLVIDELFKSGKPSIEIK